MFDVPVFVKQLGALAVQDGAARERPAHEGGGIFREQNRLSYRHPKGGDMTEWPADLRVREFPE